MVARDSRTSLPNVAIPTLTIPERGEEKEFIQHQLWKLFGKEGTEQLYLEDVKHCMGKVAAFSARRAREKAIEECLAEVPAHTKEQMKEINEGNNDFNRGFYTAFQDIHAYILRLKTK